MSDGSTQTNSSAQKKQVTAVGAALAVFRRLRRKASVVMVGVGASFLGMAIAITDADQSLFQKATGTATFGILLGLGFFAWHIRKDANKWVEIFQAQVRLEAAQQQEQEVNQPA